MKKIFPLALAIVLSQNNFAQPQSAAANYNEPTAAQTGDAKRERREQAYVKLLEGQRVLWRMNHKRRTPAETSTDALAAKESLQKAVELDPTLSEAYTALAELALLAPPHNLDEALLLANIAVKLNRDSYGGHRILARLYTIKSRLNRADLIEDAAAKAINEWKEIARLDARSAEAFAFLSEFYDKTKRPDERIAALRRWLAAAAPLETRFYQTVMGGGADLSPESASIKLGAALLDDGQTVEAIGILSRTIADNPENDRAVALLREAIETSNDKNSSIVAAQALSRAVYANPENAALVALLAQIEARAGRVDEAAKVLRAASVKLATKDKIAAANLQIALGDVFAGAERFGEALASYESAMSVRGITAGENAGIRDDERDFAIRAFEKMILVSKNANRPTDALLTIERARRLLGAHDAFADRQLIAYYRETGKHVDALRATRLLRAKNADDYGLLRLEASILTDGGRIDEAVALVKPLLGKKVVANSVAAGQTKTDAENLTAMYSPMYDDFANYLFISNLYSQAGRGREAVEAATSAVNASQGEERKQIAKLSLATAQQQSGDGAAAEATLRALLEQSPGNPIALNNLGYFLAERNVNLPEALLLIERAVKIDPTNPSYLDSLGWTYFKLEKLEQAEKYLKDALRFDSASATIQEHLGDVYQKQGKSELAKTVWQKSLNLTVDAQQINRLKTKIKFGK